MAEVAMLRQYLSEVLGDRVAFDVPLRDVSRWAIGGPATALIDVQHSDDVALIMQALHGRDEPVFVVGDTSNLLFDSAGFEGIVVRIGRGLADVTIDGNLVRAQAGVPIPRLARMTADAGLAGLAHTVGIPGTLGGLVVMNGGSQRKGIGSHVERVVYVDREGRQGELDHDACQFAYRASVLQRMDVIVTEVDLRLEFGDADEVHREMDAVVASRRSRFPEDLPNCGSTFLSDPKLYATVGPPGRAIESVGLKGVRRGGAQISEQHANFIVNNGGATSDDVLWLIALIRTTVLSATGFQMDCEVRHVGVDGRVRPAHEVALERWPMCDGASTTGLTAVSDASR